MKRLTKAQQYEQSMANIRRIGEIARIARERYGCTPQHSFKLAKRFVSINK